MWYEFEVGPSTWSREHDVPRYLRQQPRDIEKPLSDTVYIQALSVKCNANSLRHIESQNSKFGRIQISDEMGERGLAVIVLNYIPIHPFNNHVYTSGNFKLVTDAPPPSFKVPLSLLIIWHKLDNLYIVNMDEFHGMHILMLKLSFIETSNNFNTFHRTPKRFGKNII